MNGQVEVTWRTLRTIAHSHMVHARVPKIYGMENITTAEVMEKLYLFQSRFGEIDQFEWWDLEAPHVKYLQ